MASLLLIPFLGVLFLSISSSVLGVMMYLRKESLLSETLSHSAFLGVVLGVVVTYITDIDLIYPLAFIVSFLALKLVESLQKEISKDAALCFVLALFFSFSILFSSILQKSYPVAIRGANSYLYGSASGIMLQDVWIYAFLALASIIVVALYFPIIRMSYFDREYCRSIGLSTKFLDALIQVLFLFSIVTAIKSVGVVLITAMLITPAILARLWTNRLAWMFVLSALSSLICCTLGLYLSIKFRLSSGPMIVLTSSLMTFFSILFAPRGLFVKMYKRMCFSSCSKQENIVKALYKNKRLEGGQIGLQIVLLWMIKQVRVSQGKWILTRKGQRRAKLIVRRHRLWEAYLCFKLKTDPKLVHESAERAEHIMNDALEEGIEASLDYPKKDPHNQEIFSKDLL